jgi:hypothetical protein
MASSLMNIASPLYTGAISERLTKANHVTWKAQVLVVLRGACLVGHITREIKPPLQEIDGKESDKPVTNPAYEEWFASDQQVLGFLFSSVSKEVLPQIATKATAADAWKEVESMFSSQMKARKVNTRLQVSPLQITSTRCGLSLMKWLQQGELLKKKGWWSISLPALDMSMV